MRTTKQWNGYVERKAIKGNIRNIYSRLFEYF